MEQKYHDSLEQIAMLEAELSGTDDLQIELQRTKDELRDTVEELSVANGKLEAFNNYSQTYGSSSLGTNKENRAPDLTRKSSRLTLHYQGGIPEHAAVSHNKLELPPLPYSTNFHGKSLNHRLSSSKSLRRIHGMLDQMKSLENRVANFKSSLPKPITPTKLSTQIPASPPSSRVPQKPHLEIPIDLPYSQSASTPTNSNIPVPRFRISQDHLPRITSRESINEESHSKRNKRHSLSTDMYTSIRPISPSRYYEDTSLHRSRSAAGNYSPEKPSNRNSAHFDGSSDYDTPDTHKRHDSKRFGGSYQGPARTSSVISQSPRNRHSVDMLSFSGLTISETPIQAPAPHPSAALLYSHSNRSSGNMGPPLSTISQHHHHQKPPKSKPSLTGFDSFSNPFSYPSAGAAANASSSSLTSHGGSAGSTISRPGSTFGQLHSRQPLGHGRMA